MTATVSADLASLPLPPKMPPIVVATSPQAIRDILSIKDGAVDKTSLILSELRRVLGGNPFNPPYEQWLPRKRTLQPVFTKQHVRQFGGHMAEAAEKVSAGWVDGAVVDLVADRSLRPVRAPRWLPTPERRRAALHRLAGDILAKCRADPSTDAPLVQALIAATDPVTGNGLSDSEIANELIVFLFAGHDTTATTLTYAMWELGRHPDIQNLFAAEVTELPDRELEPDDVSRLSYTVQVLREALRLCPPGPTSTRMATRDVEVGGYRVPAGTLLIFGRLAVQRDPTHWDRPLVFDPDRFSPQNMKDRDRWQYIPFGGGPRACIGDHFAMLEATLGLATFIRRAEVRSLDADFPLAVPFTMVADGPIRARIRSRRRVTAERELGMPT
jgi:cytochrome P450